MRAESLWRSFYYAFEGMVYVFKTQRNAQIHSVFAVLVLLVGLFLGLPAQHWAILALTIGVVIAAEMVNTSIEAIVDLLSPEFHPLAKIAKDTAAGAVFFLAMIAVMIGLLILGPPLWTWVWTHIQTS